MMFRLRCRIDKGMFSDERAATYPPASDAKVSVFVPAGAIDGDKVVVRILRQNNCVYASLPSEERAIVRVNEGDLSEE